MMIILVTCGCGCVMLFVAQNGMLASKIMCAMLGATFAIALAFVMTMPTLFTVATGVLFTALLVWQGMSRTPAATASNVADSIVFERVQP